MTNKQFAEMTLDELREEHRRWNDQINNATAWGAALAAADEYRRACAYWIKIREAELPR